jgi:hypothetical protein
MLAPQYLARCVEVLDSRPEVVLCHTKTRIIDGRGRPVKDLQERLTIDHARPHQRYRQFFAFYLEPVECNDVFGVVRRQVLAQTRLFGSYPASDMVLLGEYALHGVFHQEAAHLFLRRDHPGTSVRANREWSKRAVWFDPRNRGKIQLVFCRWVREYLACIGRAPMPWIERLLCAQEVLRWAWRQRHGVSAEVRTVPHWLYRSLRPDRKIC